jgi:hypothetical protein
MRHVRLAHALRDMSPSAIRRFHTFLIDALTSAAMKSVFHEIQESAFFSIEIPGDDEACALSLDAEWTDFVGSGIWETDGALEVDPDAEIQYRLDLLLDSSGNFVEDLSDAHYEHWDIVFSGKDMIKLLDTLQENVRALKPYLLEGPSNGEV